ncbi:unnamed protein product [Callosobruchus maculatus]|uniref:Cyclic nucleotide-binding domain-containing protein n=1 Tax=Callosobruchus maculatus TaxID=64391 RepID=A0A653BG59_CALMS|nr:unnamed protein product [Callosobruchus maculatus]
MYPSLNCWLVIHPFSKVSYVLDWIFFLNWFGIYMLLPMYVLLDIRRWPVQIVVIRVLNKPLELLVLLTFLCRGYVDHRQKEIVLDLRKIVLRYLKTFFILDLTILFLDLGMLLGNPPEHFHTQDMILNLLMQIGLLGRAMSHIQIVCILLERIISSRTKRVVIYHAYFTTLMLHYLTVMNVLVPKYAARAETNFPPQSWLTAVFHGRQYKLDSIYFESQMLVGCYFFGVHYLKTKIWYVPEQIFLTFVALVGRLYTLYLLADILLVFGTESHPESRYEKFIVEVNEYMAAKNLPKDLRSRLLKYYECKLQKHFFREAEIMDSLSERLKMEMFLHFAMKLVHNNPSLRLLPASTLSILISKMKAETFLADDIICSIGKPHENIYFISSGTVAVFNSNGHELDHLEDGHDFGLDLGQNYAYVAMETSEVYYVKYAVLQEDTIQYHDIWRTYEKRWLILHHKYQELGERLREGGDTMLHELRRGQLLENLKHRNVL